jgi:hypothetical protein
MAAGPAAYDRGQATQVPQFQIHNQTVLLSRLMHFAYRSGPCSAMVISMREQRFPAAAAGAAAAGQPGPWAERRRLAEPGLQSQASCTRRRLPASRPATGAGPGRLAGRAIAARREQPAARPHRQPVPAPAGDHPHAMP